MSVAASAAAPAGAEFHFIATHRCAPALERSSSWRSLKLRGVQMLTITQDRRWFWGGLVCLGIAIPERVYGSNGFAAFQVACAAYLLLDWDA
jgi:hypothetical protein